MKKIKVLVGLSGGVDSAVAAYQLKKEGYDVTCGFMRNWDSFANNDIYGNPTIQNEVCPQEKDYEDALKVAKSLDLELLRIDFVKEYWDYVFKHFLDEYGRGRTPNPDILCNQYIKFDSFLNYAMDLGFDMVATGHYARVTHTTQQSYLLRGVDSNKDQTYFLCQISQDALQKTLFPIGNMDKNEVRSIAKQLQLEVATKKDSTGICFIGERNFKEFLKNYIPSKDGLIIDIDSKKILGNHVGVLYYTIGQRKGLGIGGVGGPWFVAGKNVEKNELYVCAGEQNKWLYSDHCIVKNIHWFSSDFAMQSFSCSAKFRYRQADHKVFVHVLDNETIDVVFEEPLSSITPGQEAVFYQDDICLGGGVIEEAFYKMENLQKKIQLEINQTIK